MRVLTNKERVKRGCIYCADYKIKKGGRFSDIVYMCTHSECPYHELDEHNTYESFLKSEAAGLGLLMLYTKYL